MMPCVEVADGPAIRDDMPFKVPLSAEGITQKRFAAAAGFAVCTVVSAHDSLYLCLCYKILERGKIGLFHVLWTRDCVELMAQCFRPAVHGEVLRTRGALQVLSAALQTMNIDLPFILSSKISSESSDFSPSGAFTQISPVFT